MREQILNKMTKNDVAEIGRKFAWALFQGQLMVSNQFWGPTFFARKNPVFGRFFGLWKPLGIILDHYGEFCFRRFSLIFVGFGRVSSVRHEQS